MKININKYVIFLDIDGVLNNTYTWDAASGYFPEYLQNNLVKLINRYDVDIVLISSWGHKENLNEMLTKHGLKEKIKEKIKYNIHTDSLFNTIQYRDTYSHRRECIDYFVSRPEFKKEYYNYLILDDVISYLPLKHLYKTVGTNPKYGFDNKSYSLTCEIFDNKHVSLDSKVDYLNRMLENKQSDPLN